MNHKKTFKGLSLTLFVWTAALLPSGSRAQKVISIQPGPAALKQAISAIKKIKLSGLPEGGITVLLKGGRYELDEGLVIGDDVSGTKASPVVFEAYPNEKVVISGGRRISVENAKPKGAIREVDLRALGLLDYGVHRITGFRRPYVNAAMELFIDGKPYHLARYPDDKNIMLDSGSVVDNGGREEGGHPGAVRMDKKKLAQWTHAPEIIAAGNFTYSWATDQLRVGSIDTATGTVRFQDTHPFGIKGGKDWTQYYFFNLLEELDHPGEYYIDRQKGRLYFYPAQPLHKDDTIEVSVLETPLISLKDASHIQLRGLTLEAGRGIGVYMENTQSVRVEDCTIRDMGVVGVCIGEGSMPERVHRLPDPLNRNCPDTALSGQLGSLHELLYENGLFDRKGGHDNGVVSCLIENTGCGGISLGGGNRATLNPAGNYVDNCTFVNCGRIDYSYKSPVNIDGVGNIVRHCLFMAAPATAIYVHGNNHLIEYNEIREACHFVDDQGAIYLGRDPSEAGNIIRYNYFRDIGRYELTMAVYFDDGACGSEVYGNVFYKVHGRTVLIGGGSYNPVHNNIFIDCKMSFHLDDRLSNWSHRVLDPGGLFHYRLAQVRYDRPPYATAYPWLARYFIDHPETPHHNDIWNNVLVNVDELHNGEAAWGPIHSNNFITKDDPGFVNASAGDFTLKKSSAVFEKLPDFQPIPFSEMGLRKPQDNDWKKLTLREKIGQTMLMLPDREQELHLGQGSLAAFFSKYPVGGFFMGWKLWDGVKPEDKLSHIRQRVREYQANSRLPLLFQEDYEAGVNLPGMVSFPNAMALGAAHSSGLAYAYGASVAKECRSVGINWVLHPVADLNLNPLNPIMNVRSIGDDPDEAIRLLSQQIRGLQDHGVAATIKHFPGDGVDSRDQHLLTSSNSLSFAEWQQKHGKVFQALIDSGVACIMPGHITLPAYQKEKIDGFYPPATLSRELLTDLLKEQMGFKGVIVSDAMTMGGFRGYYDNDLEGQVHSFMAGVDVLLWPSYAFMDTVEARIKRGEIPMARLDDAVKRIWAMKERFGLLAKDRPLIDSFSDADRQVAEHVADSISETAITLVRDRHHALPLDPKKDKKILLVALTPVGRKGGDTQLEELKNLAEELRRRGFHIDFRHDILFETQGWKEDAPSQYDRIIVVAARSPHMPFGPMQLWDDEAQTIWGINAMPKDKIIVVSLGSPYIINEYFQRVNTCINAYSNSPVMHCALVRALLGEVPMTGVSPVDLSSYDPVDTLGQLTECRPRGGLPHVFAKLKAGQQVTVAYLGGSITQAGDGYRDQSTKWLRDRYPGAQIRSVNAGVGGTGSDLGCFRLKRQVLDEHPDLVFVEFAVNDKNTDTAVVQETMEGIVRQIWKYNSLTDICFVYTMTADMAPVLSKGRLPLTARAMEDIAEHYYIPSVDMCLEVIQRFKEAKLIFQGKIDDHPDVMVFSADNVHPYPSTGHRLYAEALARSLEKMEQPGRTTAHVLPSPVTTDRMERAQMIGTDELKRTGKWNIVVPASGDAGVLTPEPFPVLIKGSSPGAALKVKFNGTMIGLYDVVGPGTGQWDVYLDGKKYKTISRFDSFATYWRPNYILLSDFPPGTHEVEFRVADAPLDKRTILGANATDYDAHPDKYKETAGYAGFLMLAGQLIK